MHAFAEHALANPPRCLLTVRAEPLVCPEFRIAIHPHAAFAYFATSAGCACEPADAFVLGHWPAAGKDAASLGRCALGYASLLGPYALGCPSCGLTRQLMDP